MVVYFGQQVALSAVACLVATLVAGVLFGLSYRLPDRIRPRRAAWRTLVVGTLVVIVIFTVLPVGIRAHHYRAVALVPFVGGEYNNFNVTLMYENVLGNILLFMPFGFILRVGLIRRMSRTAFAGFVTSLAVETLQYILVVGAITSSTVILNTLGTLAGAGLAVAALTLGKRLRGGAALSARMK